MSFFKKLRDPLGIKKKAKKKLKKEFKGTFFGDLIEFEDMQLKEWGRMLKENPEQALLGGLTPFGAKAWGKVTGKDYEPFVNMWGGPTEEMYLKAAEKGIDIEDVAKSHQMAEMVASWYAGGYGAQQLGALGRAAGMAQPTGSAAGLGGAGAVAPAGAGAGNISAAQMAQLSRAAVAAGAPEVRGELEPTPEFEITRPTPVPGLSVWNVPTIARGGRVMRYRDA